MKIVLKDEVVVVDIKIIRKEHIKDNFEFISSKLGVEDTLRTIQDIREGKEVMFLCLNIHNKYKEELCLNNTFFIYNMTEGEVIDIMSKYKIFCQYEDIQKFIDKFSLVI